MEDLLNQLRLLRDSLAAKDGRLDEIFVSTEIGVCLITDEGAFARLNPAWERCLGHDLGEMLNSPVLEFVHESDRQSTQAAINRLASDDTVRFWNRFRQSDGRYRTLHWVAARTEQPGTVCATVRASMWSEEADGSDREEGETASARALGATPAELYRRVVETSPDAILVTDLTGRVLIVNEEAAVQYGLTSAQELVGMSAFDFIAPQDRKRAVENAAITLRTGGVRNVEYEVLRRDGSRVSVELNAALVKDANGQPRGFIANVRDITQRKRSATALGESEERYRILYQDNPSMYFTVDAYGKVLSVNEFGAAQLGYTAEEVVGISVGDIFHAEDRKAVAKQLAACVAARGEMRHWEFRKVRKDGRVIWVKEAARATRDVNGETIVLIVCEDITERREMEEELQKAREALERKVERKMKRGRAYGLTFREMTVLHLVTKGLSDRDIATQLGISPLTVSKHVANCLSKMASSTRSEASARAVRESIVD